LANEREMFLLEQPGSREILKFATPESWLIRGGKLHLKYQIPRNATQEYTYADVRLNDSVLASVTPTAEERDAGAGELSVPLPPELLMARNELTIQLAGQGNAACAVVAEKTPPWFRIDRGSEVTLDAQPLALASELASLPQPFLEHLANSPVVLPFVFAHPPDSVTLQGAGVLASWFGSLADDSGVRYFTQMGEMPEGNAILLLLGSERMDGITVEPGHASISLEANPRDRFAKVLVVHGETGDDLLAIVQELASGQLKLAGSSVQLSQAVSLAMRSPNDAPRWIHNNRVSLDSLVGRAERRTTGQKPVDVYMHLAPDYNFGVQQNIYLHLEYSADSKELAKASNIAASLNGVPAGSMSLLATPGTHSGDIPLIDVPAAVYANTLQLQFYFVPAGADACASDGGRSTAQILGSSYLDLGRAVHYTQLPNLRLFAKAGFPFTRLADLSETAVLLPPVPSPEVTALYLDLMGYFGAQTGYPTFLVQVATPADAASLGDKDLLVLGTFGDLANSPEITSRLPLTYVDQYFQLSRRARWALMPDWLLGRDAGAWRALNGSEILWPDGLLEAIASPFASQRSLVVIAGRDRGALPGLASALLTTMPRDGIDNTASLWTTGNFISYSLSTAAYGSGDLPWYRAFSYWLPHHLFILLLLLGMVLALLALCVQRWLARRIRERLSLDHDNGRYPGIAAAKTGGSLNSAT
jgi:cellulose synthase (UDP-forming)